MSHDFLVLLILEGHLNFTSYFGYLFKFYLKQPAVETRRNVQRHQLKQESKLNEITLSHQAESGLERQRLWLWASAAGDSSDLILSNSRETQESSHPTCHCTWKACSSNMLPVFCFSRLAQLFIKCSFYITCLWLWENLWKTATTHGWRRECRPQLLCHKAIALISFSCILFQFKLQVYFLA